MIYRKHYIPLESNPEVFTQLIHGLGVSRSLAFQDVYTVDEPELLAFIPRPALALVLVFPTSETYDQDKAADELFNVAHDDCGEQEKIMFFRQTINNGCGLYGILHAVSNGDARQHIIPDSHLSRLLTTCSPLAPTERAQALEDNAELESAYRAVALQGDSEVPANAEDEVDYHYVCFVKSNKDGHLYEMDGDRKGPVDRGALQGDDDVLSERGLAVVRQFLQRESGENPNFSLLVLAPNIVDDQ